MKTVVRISDIVATILTWIVALAIGILALFLVVPKLFHCSPYIVLSGSMEPLIRTGSVVYIEEDEDREVESDDVIAYLAGDGMAVVHRVIGFGDTGYVTKGDANDVQDAKEVRPDRVIGFYKGSVPGLGYALAAIESRTLQVGPLRLPAVVPVVIGIVLMLRLFVYLLGLLPENNVGDTNNEQERN